MAEAEEAAEPAAEKPKSGMVGMIVNGLGIFVLSLGAVIAGGFVNAKLHPAPEYTLGEDNRIKVYVPPPPKPPKGKAKQGPEAVALFYSLEPPLVVNFEQSSNVRFLQIGIDFMARDPEVITALTKFTPMIRNDLLLLISNRDYTKLMTREGKEELRGEALAAVKKILKKETGAAEVEDLLFTSFVVQ